MTGNEINILQLLLFLMHVSDKSHRKLKDESTEVNKYIFIIHISLHNVVNKSGSTIPHL